LGDREKQLVDECLSSGFVSSVGAFVTDFEQRLAEYTGARFAVAVSSGTAALHLALVVAGVRPNDEVILPSATFVATANAITYCGGIPHFVDVEPGTLGLSPQALDDRLHSVAVLGEHGPLNRLTGNRIAACVPVHTFGHPADMDAVREVTARWGLRTIEDAAEALGSKLQGQHCGTFGELGTLSFNGNKIVTTGGGGALLTNDQQLAVQARHLSTTAKVAHAWQFVHDQIGFNYRMPNLNAALGCAQMERLDSMVESKRQLTETYATAFSDVSLGHLFFEPPNSRSNYWLQTFLLNESEVSLRDQILEDANSSGLQLRPLWQPLHTLRPFVDSPRGPLPVTEQLSDRVINLPSSASLL
jgi:perosamine synthetase